MIREILFRGKRLDNDKWIYGYYIRHGEKSYICPVVRASYWFDGDLCVGGVVEVDPSTVGQCVGLRDKNDRHIFDGDILLFGERKLVVWWNEEAFQWQAKETQYPCYTYDGLNHGVVWDNIDLGWIYSEIPICGKITTEIIGNIYDNPELITK